MEKEPNISELTKSPEKESDIAKNIREHLENALGNYFFENHQVALFKNDIPEMLEQMGINEEKIKVAIKELDENLKKSGQKGFLE